mgnify:CR=1 FL=1
MIEVSNISFRYPGQGKKVFNGLNLRLEENAIYGLLGKNGMGKSTLLYLISGLLQTKEGKISVDGHDPRDRKPEMLREIYIVTEDFDLPAMTLSEYVKINAPFYPNFSQEVLDNCLREFDLEGNPRLNALSMGQKKKVYMSFALATGTRYLFMDEPTNGMDIPSKAQFRKVVAQGMTDGRTVVISTHQVHDVENLLDHVIIINNSEILLNSSVEDICRQYVFEYRAPNDMADAIYAEPSLQGNAVMAPRGDKPETTLNLELLFDAMVLKAKNTQGGNKA